MPSPAHCTKLVCKPHGPHVSPFGWGTPDGCGNVRVSTTTLGFFAALFYLDGLGYIVLTAALYHPAFTRYRRLTRWALIALTAATIGAYFALVQGHLEPALDNRPGLADARVRQPIGSNELGARRVGIKVDRHLIMIYALSGLMAGFGAVLSLAQFGTTTIAGQSLTNLNVEGLSALAEAANFEQISADSRRGSVDAGFLLTSQFAMWMAWGST